MNRLDSLGHSQGFGSDDPGPAASLEAPSPAERRQGRRRRLEAIGRSLARGIRARFHFISQANHVIEVDLIIESAAVWAREPEATSDVWATHRWGALVLATRILF